MSDYLIWAGESMEKEYGKDVYYWMDHIMAGKEIPKKYSLETYGRMLEEERRRENRI